MLDLIAHNLAPIMFISVMGLLLLGYPVALTLAAGGLFYFVVGVGLSEIAPSQINLFWPLLNAQPERVFGIMSNDTLLAIPFFTFMGLILERSRMAEDLLDTIGQLFGPIRGGLAYAVLIVGALLAATTGVVAASVIAMGLISLPIMQRYGYSQSVATGSITAAGTLAQIVPPSLVLIVMADQLGVSVGDMYLGALWPALVIVGLYCAYIFVLTLVRPSLVPALPVEDRTLGKGILSLVVLLAIAVGLYFVTRHTIYAHMVSATAVVASAATAVIVAYLAAVVNGVFKLKILSYLAERVVIVLIPPLALIFLVLGTIFLGIATPTEGGAMGAVGALVLAFAKRRLDFATLRSAVEATATLSAFVMFILVGARVFSLTFYGVNGNIWLEELLLALPGGQTGFLVTVTVVIFILGCFLDFFEIAFILVPLLAPVAAKLGIDLVWFGVILGINLQTSFLTPPFGFSLFYLRSVASSQDTTDPVTGRTLAAIRTASIYRGVLPFIVIQFLMILLVIMVPSLVQHATRRPAPPAPVTTPSTGGTTAPANGAPGLGLPPLFGAPQSGASAPASTAPGTSAPSMGLPPITFGGGGSNAPAAAPASPTPAAPQLGLPPLFGPSGGAAPSGGNAQPAAPATPAPSGQAPSGQAPAQGGAQSLGLPPLNFGTGSPAPAQPAAPAAPQPPAPSTGQNTGGTPSPAQAPQLGLPPINFGAPSGSTERP
ncbi:C4-dicarboxylate ABC transporter [Acuticoccus sediminis]|uniref:C4-dicarboxylate ABC transporter n=1 Tax=Acuticoccus sediminis TaxID=2184697 RepID=A0A8B2NEP5_9HYPH|nr:TRAP transporter large permease subunit [Acuticoccus sediminis]RAH97258.1 C4-dicarboxylate ABC transporter [Acuticoccus sediminis]